MPEVIDFLPMTKAECNKLGWKELDIIIVTGDAYVDHHSFGAAIIGRYLTANNYRVGIIAQPDVTKKTDFFALGKPKLFFGVTSGNMDSMINHYTAQKKIRSQDSYSPNGEMGLRPDRATIVYTQKLKQYFKDVPVIIGGIEASLRRIPHYDYWQDKIRNSILFDSKASVLVYGMAEKTILKIADQLAAGKLLSDLNNISGTVVSVSKPDEEGIQLPAFEDIKDKESFYEMSKAFIKHSTDKVIYQRFGFRYLKHNPPAQSLNSAEIDEIYDLPFSRAPHPQYKGKKIPAYEQIKDSVTTHRGCFGGCNFCSIFFHQGKQIQSRSKQSILNEIKQMAKRPSFSGTITDVGGPSANMYSISCNEEKCSRISCLVPEICPKLNTNHKEYLDLLNRCRNLETVNNIFISSGIRTDLALKSNLFIKQLAAYHTSGRIKVAPEHKSKTVLEAMNKQDFSTYEQFKDRFIDCCKTTDKRYAVIPYFIVGHPGTTIKDAIELAVYLKRNNMQIEQIQEFTPTPMSISTLMYYTAKGYQTGKPIFVPKGREVRLQKALAQWFIPSNKKYVIEALQKANRKDLIRYFYDK